MKARRQPSEDRARADLCVSVCESGEIRFTQAAYTFVEGLRLLDIPRSSGYLLVQRGELKTFMVGGRRLISAIEIARVIRDRECGNAISQSVAEC